MLKFFKNDYYRAKETLDFIEEDIKWGDPQLMDDLMTSRYLYSSAFVRSDSYGIYKKFPASGRHAGAILNTLSYAAVKYIQNRYSVNYGEVYHMDYSNYVFGERLPYDAAIVNKKVFNRIAFVLDFDYAKEQWSIISSPYLDNILATSFAKDDDIYIDSDTNAFDYLIYRLSALASDWRSDYLPLYPSRDKEKRSIARETQEHFRYRSIQRVWIFGSYAQYRARLDSDVDFLIEPMPGKEIEVSLEELKDKLEECLGLSVKLVLAGTLPPLVAANVDESKVLIYEDASVNKNVC